MSMLKISCQEQDIGIGVGMNAYASHFTSFSDSELGSDSDCGGEQGSEVEDSDEEPDEDEEESDGSSTQALIDHVESSFLILLDQTVEQVEKNHDKHQQIKIPSVKVSTKESRDEETQTDATSATEHEHVAATAIPTEKDADLRDEIASLRLARETLVNQKKEVADRVKQGASVDHQADEKKVYEYEEAIEAIDFVIEFKNELICGTEFYLSNCLAPGRNEADLVTRLTNLTTLDLQRLLWKYFSKVVEIRYSSKRLEKQIEELECHCEKMEINLTRNQKHLKDMQTGYDSRIKLIIGLYSKDPNSALDEYLHSLENKLATALKKQYDLERSLTELLVRHGYLLNGTDYDVKQIVKMLGIDTVQMGLNWRPEEKPKKKSEHQNLGHSPYHGSSAGYGGGASAGGAGTSSSGIPLNIRLALESGMGSQGMSRRMREAYVHRRQPPHRSHHHYTNHHRDRDRDRDLGVLEAPELHHPPQPPPPEVRRKKQKIIIQPRSNTPEPS